MAASDIAITLAWFLKWDAPGGAVRLSDGGQLDYADERYQSFDAVFGSVMTWPSISGGFNGMAERGRITFAPEKDAALAAWWRADLFDTRLRLWVGELDADGITVTTAKQLADWLVDNISRVQGEGGQDLLALDLTARAEKLFLVNEGNVCSERFHSSVWPGEIGFRNCTDVPAPVAWGTAMPLGGGNAAPPAASNQQLRRFS